MLKRILNSLLLSFGIKATILFSICLLPSAYCQAQKGDSSLVSIPKDPNPAKKEKNRSSIAPLPECCSSPEKESDTSGTFKNFIFSGSAYTNVIMGKKFDTAGFEAGFMPVFLFRPNKRLYFVVHMHMSAGAGQMHTTTVSSGVAASGHTHGTSTTATTMTMPMSSTNAVDIMVYYANMVYYINHYLTITGGMFPSPFGIYPERLHLPWQNDLPDAPLGMGHADQAIPLVEMGFQASGETSIYHSKINYALFVSNGPALTETGNDAGKLTYSNIADNNKNKTVGGRIGMLPLHNSSLELGLFGQKGKAGLATSNFSGVDVLLYGADITIHQKIKPLKGTIDVKGQYNVISLDKVYYKADPVLTVSVPEEDVNLADSTYRFNNTSTIGFVSAAYRPVASQNFLKNTEYVLRYDMLSMPCYALWNASKTRITAGIVYWMDTRSSVKFSFQTNLLPKQVGQDQVYNNAFIMQWEIGL